MLYTIATQCKFFFLEAKFLSSLPPCRASGASNIKKAVSFLSCYAQVRYNWSI